MLIYADRGEMRLNTHTARYFNVHGSQGVRNLGRTTVYSTTNPFFFTGRVVLETGEGHYRIIDGTMTNCRLPKPDWQIISRAIKLSDGKASTTNAVFKFLGVPLFYLPYLSHPVDETGRSSGILIPAGENSGVKGLVIGEQVYWVISRNMDMIVGAEYWSKRGWAPNGDFRYRGAGLNHATVRWNALLDRGVEQHPFTTGQPRPHCSTRAAWTSTPRGARIWMRRPVWPARSNISPATFTVWSSTITTRWPLPPRCRALYR